MYYDLLVKAFYACTIIKVPALLVLSINNKYTELVRSGKLTSDVAGTWAGKVFNREWVLFK